ncbi:MAG: hypothetical protein Q8P41_02775 [Pseudomonadota bacterium]|nr:hypothetical protein [Pseudomonadota bacterium]
MRLLFPLAILPFVACTDKSIPLGGGAPADARLYADIYTWECEDASAALYEGVFGYKLSLEYAPDALEDRDLPSSGCTRGLDIFPADAGSDGLDIPDVTSPDWATAESSGTLSRVTEGFYYDDVFDNRSSCTNVDELLSDGTALSNAGVFSGATAPVPGTLEDVELEGEVDEETGIPFGTEVTATWNASGWDSSWVQIRREKDGALVESVTCTTDGQESFTVDDDVWSLLSDALEADVTNLYVAFQVDGGSTTSDGQEITTSTRAMHVAVVQD